MCSWPRIMPPKYVCAMAAAAALTPLPSRYGAARMHAAARLASMQQRGAFDARAHAVRLVADVLLTDAHRSFTALPFSPRQAAPAGLVHLVQPSRPPGGCCIAAPAALAQARHDHT